MKKDVLDRYERDPDGTILIDVAAEKVEDLYEDFDRSAPYIRRDLDQDLVDYLIASARELGRERFGIRFSLVLPPDEVRVARTRRSVNGFFLYLAEVERQKIRRMMRRSLVLAALGVVILILSVWVNRWVGEGTTVVANVFAEGITVAAWVALWEALAVFLVEWFPSRGDLRLYRRLASVEPRFRSGPTGGKPG